MNEPLMPGRIMAQMASATGEEDEEQTGGAGPGVHHSDGNGNGRTEHQTDHGSNIPFPQSLPHSQTLAAINPKKKLQINTG